MNRLLQRNVLTLARVTWHRYGPATMSVTPLRRAYHERVIDQFENPRNIGSLDKKASNVGTGLVGAPACGDVMKFQIRVNDDGVIEESVFKTFGCGSAIASSSLATEWVKGKKVDERYRSSCVNCRLFCFSGCLFAVMSIAAVSSAMAAAANGELVTDLRLQALSISNDQIAKHLSLPPVKRHCSMLAEDAIRAAVKDWQTKQKKQEQ